MLRNRSSSRAVTNKKQALMADQTSLLSPTSPISTFLASPKIFNIFLSKNPPDSDSPTSILDSKNSSPSFSANPFGLDRGLSKSNSKPQIQSPKPGGDQAIGLALIDSIIEEKSGDEGVLFSKPVNRMALFGSKLKVQIPVINPSSSPGEELSPKSPADFGIKTRNSQQVLSPFVGSSRDLSRQLSLKEMEMSEDYTCVITHGPNPKTTHIFDDCIVECCCGGADDGASMAAPKSGDFLKGICHNCKGFLGSGKDDLCIYRGEKALCSHECHCQEKLSQTETNNNGDEMMMMMEHSTL
ncbi:FCS-Like Zinc finger 8-like [Andrographis paniculata]|uniref:FCS-Like Zinc finger 8-like n=1 Tax=Andrographis paniculata TaxID=175694 RepID=UPI0021E7362D|nr:FCS-Like Zinc finger 8-like [Andrographis paniculata]